MQLNKETSKKLKLKTIQTTSPKEIKRIQQFLLDIPNINKCKFIDSQLSSVSTKWGVSWSEFAIVRDYLQNFYDNHRDDVGAINIKIINDLISVTAPKEFDLRELYFLGSQKTNDPTTVGAYGEGFKAATVSLIKLGHDYVTSVSGNMACVISIGDQVEGNLDIRPLVYNFFEINPQKGCGLFIKSYNEQLKSAFKIGLDQYWYEENPLVGEMLHQHNEFSFYKSKDEKGHIFYGSIKRAEIKDIPIVININKKYTQIEKKVSADRDRNTFDDRLTSSLYKIIFKEGFHHTTPASHPVIDYILNSSKKLWEKGKGHPLLQAMADNFGYLCNYEEDKTHLKKMFGDKYYSESSYKYLRTRQSSWWEIQPDIYLKEREYKKEGKIELPAYFSFFGVKCAAEEIEIENIKIKKEAENKNTEPLTGQEISGLKICLECAKEIAPEFRSLFSDVLEGSYSTEKGRLYNVSFMSVTSEKLLGELKSSGKTFGDKIVYLNKKLFTSNFGEVFSTLLHEFCHLFGRDGDRSFTDSLTIVMCRIINNPKIVDEYIQKWEAHKVELKSNSTIH